MQNPPSPLDTLRQLKEMLDAGALTPSEFEALKQRLVFNEPPIALSLPPAAPPLPVFETAAVAPPIVPRAPADGLPVPLAAPALLIESEPLPKPFQEQLAEPVADWLNPNLVEAELPPARSGPLGLVIAIGAVLAFLAVVVYLSMNRSPSEHISSTSQTAADSLATAVETGPQAAPLPPAPVAAPETVRVAPAHPAPALPARAHAPVRDSVIAAPVLPATDSAARP